MHICVYMFLNKLTGLFGGNERDIMSNNWIISSEMSSRGGNANRIR